MAVIGPAVEALGYELLGVELSGGGGQARLCVYVDSPEGITVTDCERVSHQVSGVLDVEDPIRGHYVLEVSSPGLDRPLFTLAHFQRYVGERARITFKVPFQGRKRLHGVIRRVADDCVVIVEDDQEWQVPVERIARARLVPDV